MRVFFKKIISLMVVFIFVVSNVTYATDTPNEDRSFTPTNSSYASWIFLGVVENEFGETYDYFFEMQRKAQNFHVKAALFNSQTKELVFKEDSEAILDGGESNYNWLVGSAFLKYYKISNSWVFGLKAPNKQGFNFKVSMLNKPDDTLITRNFQDGISYIVAQVGHLNGNINMGDKDQFVTSKNTWFQQIWLKKDLSVIKNFHNLLCRLSEGQALYSFKTLDTAHENNCMVGMLDNEGKSTRVSQFMNFSKNKEGDWDIDIPTPKLRLKLSDLFKENDAVAGYMTDKNGRGFCYMSTEQISAK